MTVTAAPARAHELDYRENDGVEVALLWYPATNRLAVRVNDTRANEQFELDVESYEALDAFHHPYAYAAYRGVDYQLAAKTEPVYA